MSHLSFSILAFSTNFCPIKNCLSGNTVWKVASVCQKLAKLTIFGIFNELLSTEIVNVARFARNVECDFFCDFQTPCLQGQILFHKWISMQSFAKWPKRLFLVLNTNTDTLHLHFKSYMKYRGKKTSHPPFVATLKVLHILIQGVQASFIFLSNLRLSCLVTLL